MLYLPIIFKKKKDYLSILNKLHSLAEQLMKDRELRKNETRIFCKYILQPNVREKKKKKDGRTFMPSYKKNVPH